MWLAASNWPCHRASVDANPHNDGTLFIRSFISSILLHLNHCILYKISLLYSPKIQVAEEGHYEIECVQWNLLPPPSSQIKWADSHRDWLWLGYAFSSTLHFYCIRIWLESVVVCCHLYTFVCFYILLPLLFAVSLSHNHISSVTLFWVEL